MNTSKFLLLVLLFSNPAWACLNKIYPIDMDGLLAENKEKELRYIKGINNAVDLIIAGQSQKAIEVLTALEKDSPGRYETASNLGTAYELDGLLDDALIWIKKGIKINPDSHDGTEWLHYEIIKAKQNLRLNSDWLNDNSIIDLNAVDSGKAMNGLVYQLGERTKFVSPPNSIVADLFYLMGLIHHNEENLFLRDKAFKQSLKYSQLREEKIKLIKRKEMLRLQL
ncbi:tetratricopeptide repeat protein [Marinicella sp. S1101]|uniref:tetratricopeptide repeat protein n=1 Tax=Marinicella marina TaxID=2996016 RepID=UPI002260ADF1|nr:tetratricopeptide repeat protein [Marinicella marina]MCX7552496.1 tetratricopeptide repeat protein [Marinicella marina]MDJ1139372.1 tetratricopeptide repeat protein [Marinicella marina]